MRRFLLILFLILSACQVAPTPAGPQFTVRTHPAGDLYTGDLVSFEILAPDGYQGSDQVINITIMEQNLGQANFQPFGIGRRQQATFYWVWDTKQLEPGDYHIEFSITPSRIRWTETLTLRPAAEIPPPGPDSSWQMTQSTCCIIHYISGTDAERDLATLKQLADTQAANVEKRMNARFNSKATITFLPRTLGHGGFASSEIFISYHNRNYAGGDVGQVIHHELVHLLDTRTSPRYKPTILVEGLAVYLSGGHFKREPIFPRAAALLQLDLYIPLEKLSNNFYPSQHEIGYMEAGALVGYLVETYGWEPFLAFYRDIEYIETGKPTQGLDTALQKHFQRSFKQTEQDFLAYLGWQTVTQAHLDDVRLTIDYYNTMREYQLEYDPSAHYLTAWLVDINQMRERNIIADYTRHPNEWINQRLEELLISANADLMAGHYPQAETKLKLVKTILGR